MQRQRFYDVSCLPWARKTVQYECNATIVFNLSWYGKKRLPPVSGR